jgi:transposase InsO family protein
VGARNDKEDHTRKEEKEGYGVRPWACAKMSLSVRPSGRDKKNRCRRLREDKEMVRRGLRRSPYVKLSWVEPTHAHQVQTAALVDTGADWSLLAESELSSMERSEIKAVDMVGQGVTKQTLPIVGAVWRSVKLGNVVVPDQRFIVVSEMITEVILGADFWARFGEFTLDFKEGRLKIPKLGISVKLWESPRDDELRKEDEGVGIAVVTVNRTRVPGFSEALVEASIDGGIRDGETVLVDPMLGSEEMFGVPYSVATVRNGRIKIRVANAGAEELTVDEDTRLGVAFKDFTTCPTAAPNWKRGKVASTTNKQRDDISRMCGSNKDLDKKRRLELTNVLQEFADVFYSGGEMHAVNVGVEHEIRLRSNTAPIAHRPRRLSPDEEEEVKAEIDELKDMGLVRESNSPWAAPIVCARRKNGALRLAIDYRGLNAVSVPATMHPIPRVDDLFDRLGEARYFSVLDAKSGYHQMPLSAEESELTAFVVPWGQYEFSDVTPFGLKGAGYSFQRFMSTILGDCNYTDALCYLDDVLVWGRTWEEHQERLRRVLGRIREAGLKLSGSKCKFGLKEVEYLGTTVRHGMLSISKDRVKVLRELPKPSTVTELRSALGAFAFVQRWLPGLAGVSRPLYRVCSGKTKKQLEWGPEQDAAFERLKELTAGAVELKIPDLDKEFILVTDGSDVGVGSLLAQRSEEDHDVLQPVAFYHHALSEHEKKYNTTDKELLAVVLSIKKFRIYLGKKFCLITDHKAVKFLKTLNANDEKGRRGRWIEFLQQFDMVLQYRSGASYELSMADYLSRVTASGKVETRGDIGVVSSRADGKEMVVGLLGREEIMKAQSEDPQVARWISMLGKGMTCTEEVMVERMMLDSDGLLRVKYSGGRRTSVKPWGVKEIYRIVVPKAMVKPVLYLVHDSPAGGHMGFRRTYKRCREVFWWREMSQDVKEYVGNCEGCGKNKYVTHPNVAPLQETDVPDQVFDKIQVDFLGPFPQSTAHDYIYALQIQDILSRYVVFVPTLDCTALTAATAVYEDWLCKYGPPSIIQSDRGTHFSAEVFKEMCELAGIKHKMGAPGHPHSQGQVERQNQLNMQVRCLAQNKVDLWPQAMLRVAFAHNTSLNETTGVSPYEVVYGRDPRTVEKILLKESQSSGNVTASVETDKGLMKQHVEELSEAKLAITQEIKKRTIHAQKIRAEGNFRKGEKYTVGDEVRIKLSTSERGKQGGKKMAPLYSDGYAVKEVLGQGWTYMLQPLNGHGAVKMRHFNELKELRRYPEQEDAHPTVVLDVQTRKDDVTLPTRKNTHIGKQTQGDGPEQTLRRSKRNRHPVVKLSMTETTGKRYMEEPVPLTEDTTISEEEEDEE